MLVPTSGKKCTGKSHILECCLVAVQHCRDKWTSACIIHHIWRVTHWMVSDQRNLTPDQQTCWWLKLTHQCPEHLATAFLQLYHWQEHLRVYLCLPLVSTEDEEILSIGEPNPGKLLFFLVSVTSFSRDTKSSRRKSLAARLVADCSSLAMGCSPMPRAEGGSRGCRRK